MGDIAAMLATDPAAACEAAAVLSSIDDFTVENPGREAGEELLGGKPSQRLLVHGRDDFFGTHGRIPVNTASRRMQHLQRIDSLAIEAKPVRANLG